MPKPSLQAAAEGLPSLTRRSFLANTAAAGAAVVATGSAAVAAQAIPNEKSSAINVLLAEYMRETRRGTALMEQYTQAEAAIPNWARTGPSQMLADGTKTGPISGWPELEVLPTPNPKRPDAKYTIRPSVFEALRDARETIYDGPHVIRHEDGTFTVLNPPPVTGDRRRAARLRGYQKVREIIARTRHKHAEEAKVGLPAIEAAMDANCDRISALEAEIRELASGISPAEIATLALFEFLRDREDFALSLLNRTAPHLSGLLRILVLDMIAVGPDDPYKSLLYLGDIPTEARA